MKRDPICLVIGEPISWAQAGRDDSGSFYVAWEKEGRRYARRDSMSLFHSVLGNLFRIDVTLDDVRVTRAGAGGSADTETTEKKD